MNQVLIIAGSARPNGNTATVVQQLRSLLKTSGPAIDLAQATFRPFDYGNTAEDSKLIAVLNAMVHHKHIIFVTPVYWYSMSGVMKVFFDRLTDIISNPETKHIGRKLSGHQVSLVANGIDAVLPPGFCEPFSHTANYFSMIWAGSCYLRAEKKGGFSKSELDKLALFIDGGSFTEG